MGEYSKFNLVYRLQKWMDSVPGQTFLNYAYSWGASVVILGTLFKLTHLPGANFWLFLGMGTEVFVFFISAFDRPFDKTADGRDLPTHVTEEYLENGKVVYNNQPQDDMSQTDDAATVATVDGSATVVTGQNTTSAAVVATQGATPASNAATIGAAPVGGTVVINGAIGSQQPDYVPQMTPEEAEALNEAQGNYVEQLKQLVDTLSKVNEQSMRLTRDSEEMENLNRTLTGITKVYEMQLKGASQQIGTIDLINEQSKKMAQQIEQLNQIYSRMIEAMTANMAK